MITDIRMVSFVHESIPPCASAIISHSAEHFGLHGTGFFVRKNTAVGFVTACHCLGRTGVDMAQVAATLMIPYQHDADGALIDSDYVPFGEVISARAMERRSEFFGLDADLDIALLRTDALEPGGRDMLLRRAAHLPPTGDWFENTLRALRPPMASALRFVVHGFPRNGTATFVDSESKTIHLQSAVLTAKCLGAGDYPHTIKIAFDEEPVPIRDADGLSGAPVFVIVKRGQYALAGVMLRGTYPVAQFATVRWFTDLANKTILLEEPPASSQ